MDSELGDYSDVLKEHWYGVRYIAVHSLPRRYEAVDVIVVTRANKNAVMI